MMMTMMIPRQSHADGVKFGSALMNRRVIEVVRSCSCHVRAVQRIMPLLKFDAGKRIGNSGLTTAMHCSRQATSIDFSSCLWRSLSAAARQYMYMCAVPRAHRAFCDRSFAAADASLRSSLLLAQKVRLWQTFSFNYSATLWHFGLLLYYKS